MHQLTQQDRMQGICQALFHLVTGQANVVAGSRFYVNRTKYIVSDTDLLRTRDQS